MSGEVNGVRTFFLVGYVCDVGTFIFVFLVRRDISMTKVVLTSDAMLVVQKEKMD